LTGVHMRTTVNGKGTEILALLDSQRAVLERIASGAPLSESLLTLVKLIEQQAPGVRCAILLSDPAGKRLRFAAAPSIPDEFKSHMEPYLRIADDMANCGAAAFRREPVYTEDASADPRWAHSRDLVLRHGVRAVWSTPVLSDDNSVLGTFAMFHGKPGLPSREQVQLIDMAVQLARVAIEAKCDSELLRILFDSTPGATAITNLRGVIVGVNTAFAGMLGYAPNDLYGKQMAEISADAGGPDLIESLLWTNGADVATVRHFRHKSGALISAYASSRLRADSANEARYVVTQVAQVSEAEGRALAALSHREREVLELVVAGRTSKDIAARLRLSPGSVHTYRSRMMAKLGADNLVTLVRLAIRHGITKP
jgi:PAS domain S-box-containing protein